MTQLNLPKHIRQLVDKKNYVIAIKTYAQEQNISIDAAKQAIDAYEASQTPAWIKDDTADKLQPAKSNRPNQSNWLKRVVLVVLVMMIFGGLMYQKFGG
ncbi:hypothetical protein MOMA_08671 [Moraxella macacae 0408225]|uniref:Uncharacterized protein n=1 Tax=Moraxella macacae 0408225 TaxID=1230338 RepID=L2F6V8_9GAMM|nr:hypothetical protein [Moraxella macacae]ELA08620.1 hypothetical protein MOMA_08671 [Moraxella macacae 0408225]